MNQIIEVVALFAPDGNIQPVFGENLIEAMAYNQMMATHGITQSYGELRASGFNFLPCKLTIEVTGTTEDAFKAAKAVMKNEKP